MRIRLFFIIILLSCGFAYTSDLDTTCPPSDSVQANDNCNFPNPCPGSEPSVTINAPATVGLGCTFFVSAQGGDWDQQDCTSDEMLGDYLYTEMIWPSAEKVSGSGCNWNPQDHSVYSFSYTFKATSMTSYNASACGKEDGCVYPEGDASADASIEVVCTWEFMFHPEIVCPGDIAFVSVYTNTCIDETADLWEVFSVDGGAATLISISDEGSGFYELRVKVEDDAKKGDVTVKAKHPLDGSCCGSDKFSIEEKKDIPKPPSGNGKGGCVGCSNGSSGNNPAQANSTNPGVAVSMGNLSNGDNAGSFSFDEEFPSTGIGKRSALNWKLGGSNVEHYTHEDGGLRSIIPDFSISADSSRIAVIKDEQGLRQVAHSGLLADIVTTKIGDSHPIPDAYEIRLYKKGDYFASSTDTLYEIEVGADPVAVYEVSNWGAPWGGDLVTVDFFENSTSGLVHRKRYEYQYVETTPDEEWAWELSIQNYNDASDTYETLRFEKTTWLVDPTTGSLTRTYAVSENDSSPVFFDVVDVFNSDDRHVSRTVAGETTTWDYYTTGDDIGKLALVTNPDGTWRAYQYNNAQTRTTISGWNNEPAPQISNIASITTSSAGDYRVKVRTLYPQGELDFSDPRIGRTLSETEYIQGIEFNSISYSYDKSGNILKITKNETGGGNTLKTVSHVDTSNNDRLVTIQYPDGRFNAFEYNLIAASGVTLPAGITNDELYYQKEVAYAGLSTEDDQVGAYIGNISTKRRILRNSRGQVVLEEEYVCTNQTPQNRSNSSWTSSPVSWTAYDYDEQGRQTHEYRSNGTVRSVDYAQDACCGSKTTTDEAGVVTEEVYDALGRLTQKTLHPGDGSNPNAPAPIVTDYDYCYVDGGDGKYYLEVETDITAGTESMNGQVKRYDAHGRLVRLTDSAGLTSIVTFDTTTDGRRKEILLSPDSSSVIKEYFLDGKTHSIRGDTIEQAFSYALSESGQIIQTAYLGTSDPVQGSSRWSKIYMNSLLQVQKTEQPAFGSGSIETIKTYEADTGLLLSTASTGSPEFIHKYDLDDSITRVGVDADGNGELEPNSTDRYTSTSTSFVEDTDGYWWSQTESTQYLMNNDGGTSKLVKTEKTRLTGYSSSFDTDHVTHESETEILIIPSDGDSVTQTVNTTVSTDRNSARLVATTTTTASDETQSSTDSIVVTEYGRTKSEQSATGVVRTFGYDGFGHRTTVTDGRSNTQTTSYNSLGQIESTEDGVGNTTNYTFCPTTGRLKTISNQIGVSEVKTHYGYDKQGRLVKIWGDVPQPTWTEYDEFGQREYLHMYRSESPCGEGDWPQGDVTTWEYDPATGLLTSQKDAFQKSVDYSYTPEGKLQERKWARPDPSFPTQQLTTTYVYYTDADSPLDGITGELKAIDYSDTRDTVENPYDIVFTYTRSGRVKAVVDHRTSSPNYAFDYSKWPTEVKETITWGGNQESELIRSYNGMKRLKNLSLDDLAYSVIYSYDDVTGRMDEVAGPGLPDEGAAYTYVTGTDYVSQTTFLENQGGTPKEIASSNRLYEPNRDLISSVSNWTYPSGMPSVQVSEYAFINDALGRRTQVTYSGDAFDSPTSIVQTLGYNNRNELTFASDSPSEQKFSFAYDNIGNRTLMDIDDGAQVVDYSTNELNQYYLVTKEDDSTGYYSNLLQYDDDGNLVKILHRDAKETFRGGFVDDMTGPTADMGASGGEIASIPMAAPMMMLEGTGDPQTNELIFTDGDLSITLKQVGGGQVGTTLQSHTTYKLKYSSDIAATGFAVVAYAPSAGQGLDNAVAPNNGDWSDTTNFSFIDLETENGSLDTTGNGRLAKTDIVSNNLAASAGTSGKLCKFTTGDAGDLRLQIELIHMDSLTFEINFRTISLDLEVVDSLAIGVSEPVVLASTSFASSWNVDGDSAPQLLAWYAEENGIGNEQIAINTNLSNKALSSQSTDTHAKSTSVYSGESQSLFAASDFSLALLASVLGQSAPEIVYDFDNDGDVDSQDYAALMLMGQAQPDQSILYTWDHENRLTSIEPLSPQTGDDQRISFAYDYRGRRISKTVQSWNPILNNNAGDWDVPVTDIRYVYDGWRVIAEYDASFDTQQEISLTSKRYYTWGLDLSGSLDGASGVGGLLAVKDIESAGSSYIYFYDANGNVVQLIDLDDLSIAVDYEYSPFGNRINSEGANEYDQPFRFSTKMFDFEAKLGYWGYRYYSYDLGRWLTEDPIDELGLFMLHQNSFDSPDPPHKGKPNSYRANRNDPISWVDPNGMFAQKLPPLDKFPSFDEKGVPYYRYEHPESETPYYGEWPSKKNCLGYAFGHGCSISPIEFSLFDMAGMKGYSCTKGVSSASCGKHCGCCNDYSVIYVYVHKDVPEEYWDSVRNHNKKRNTFGNSWSANWGKGIDFHCLKGRRCSGYTFIGEHADNPPVEGWSPSPQKPEYFEERRLIGTACCCKQSK